MDVSVDYVCLMYALIIFLSLPFFTNKKMKENYKCFFHYLLSYGS